MMNYFFSKQNNLKGLNIKKAILILLLIAIVSYVLVVSCDRYRLGVKAGEGNLSKSLFFRDNFTWDIYNIQVGNFDSSPGKEIVIFTQYSCVILDAKTRGVKKSIKFDRSVDSRPELLHIKEDGSLEIMLRGGGFGDVGLVNTKGEFIWKYKQEGTSPRMAAGDLDRDGELEFYVADFGGVRRLDYSGKEIWRAKASDNNWEDYIQIYDPGGDKIPLIVTRGSFGYIRLWDNTGRLVKKVIPHKESYHLEVIKWPDDYHVLAKRDYDIIIMDIDGKVVFEYRLKEDLFKFFVHLLEIMAIRGVPVKFEPDKKPYLAVITGFRAALSKAMLSIFSPEGQLVYQEMLNSTRGINVIEKPDGSEELLVGDGMKNVWIYELAKK